MWILNTQLSGRFSELLRGVREGDMSTDYTKPSQLWNLYYPTPSSGSSFVFSGVTEPTLITAIVVAVATTGTNATSKFLIHRGLVQFGELDIGTVAKGNSVSYLLPESEQLFEAGDVLHLAQSGAETVGVYYLQVYGTSPWC